MTELTSARWRRPVMWAAIPGILGAGRSVDAISVALPDIRSEHDVHIHQLLWVIVAYVIAQAVVLLAAGRAGDRVGRRPVFMVGLVVLAAGSAAAAVAPGHVWLVVARVVEGIGAGILISGSFAIVRDAAPVELLGRAFGLWAMVIGFGALLGPAINGALTEHGSWRWVMAMNAALAVVALVLTPRFLPSDRPQTIVRPDTRRVLRSENYLVATATIGLVSAILGIMAFTVTFYLHTVHALTAFQIGLVFAAYGSFYLVLSPFTGRLADRIGIRRPIVIGLAILTAAAVELSFAAHASHLLATIVGLAAVGTGVAFVAPAINAAAFAQIHVEDRSDASGLFWMSRLVASGVGVAVSAIMFASLSDTTKPEIGVAAGHDAAASSIWIVGAIIAVIAAVVALTGLRTMDSAVSSGELD